MAAPVINTTTSVLGYHQHETWDYQPHATNTPTYWNVSGLPNGMSFDLATGLISGAALDPGVYIVGLIAGNDTGPSAQIVITIGIEAGSIGTPANEVDVTIDLQTRLVAFGSTTGTNAPIFFAKSGDTMYFRIRFIKGGVVADLDLTNLFLVLKADDTEATNLVTSSAFIKDGTGENATYLLVSNLVSSALTSALSNEESPDGTTIPSLLSEFEWVGAAAHPISGIPFRTTSQTFLVSLTRELHPNV